MIAGDEPVMIFSEKEKSLYISIHKRQIGMIELTILNGMAEPMIKMKLISGSHRIDLASLQHKEYMIKLVAGDNVWLQKITIRKA
jgi:hypothetical protein